MSRVLTVGEALGVFAATRCGPLAVGSPMVLSIAGAELNTAIAMARLGISVEMVGAVGNDRTGDLILRTLRGEGVSTCAMEILPYPTGHYVKEWYGLGLEPKVYYLRQGSAMTYWRGDTGTGDLFIETAWMHTTGITFMLGAELREVAIQFLHRAHAQGLRQVSLDINLRQMLGSVHHWREMLKRVLPYASIIFATRKELEEVWNISSVSDLWSGGTLADSTVLVVKEVTCAKVYVEGEVIAEAPRIAVAQVVDVVGAGDGFAGGVIAGQMRGLDWQESLNVGQIVGAFSVASQGDWEGYPDWKTVRAVQQQRWIDR